MRRLLLAFSVVFAIGGTCMSGGGEEAPEEDDPVVVPVEDDEDDDDDEDWCCEYKDDEGTTQYALVDGPSECNTEYGTKEGRYVSGNQCIPCCCKSPKDPDDAEKGDAYELTTPKSCAVNAGGDCLKAEHEECTGKGGGKGKGRDKDKDKDKDKDRGKNKKPVRPKPPRNPGRGRKSIPPPNKR